MYIYIYIYVYVYLSLSLSLCMYVCIYIYTYIHMCVYIYIYIYICIVKTHCNIYYMTRCITSICKYDIRLHYELLFRKVTLVTCTLPTRITRITTPR